MRIRNPRREYTATRIILLNIVAIAAESCDVLRRPLRIMDAPEKQRENLMVSLMPLAFFAQPWASVFCLGFTRRGESPAGRETAGCGRLDEKSLAHLSAKGSNTT
jgi:hypothetical protein